MANPDIEKAHQAYDEGRHNEAYFLASRALSVEPDNVNGLNLIARVNIDPYGRFPEAIEATQRFLKLRPDNSLGRRMGHALVSGGYAEEGYDLLRNYLEHNPGCASTLGRLIEYRLDCKDAAGARRYLEQLKTHGDPQNEFLSTAYGDFQELRLKRLDQELAASKPVQVFPKIIAVCSVSFSGSTFFSELLGRLDGAVNIGESHTLVKGIARDENRRRLPMSPENATVENMLPCSVCGQEPCKTWHIDFRRQLMVDPTQWYRRILEYAGGQVLIASDKNFNHYVELDPLQRFDAVVLFKSPVNSYFSQYKRTQKNEGVGIKTFSPKQYLTAWKRAYEKFLYALEPAGKTLFVSWEMFTLDPYYHLKRICGYLDIEFAHDLLEREQERACCFGGNYNVVKQFQEKRITVRTEERPAELPAGMVQEIEADAGAARLFAELRSRYFSMF